MPSSNPLFQTPGSFFITLQHVGAMIGSIFGWAVLEFLAFVREEVLHDVALEVLAVFALRTSRCRTVSLTSVSEIQ